MDGQVPTEAESDVQAQVPNAAHVETTNPTLSQQKAQRETVKLAERPSWKDTQGLFERIPDSDYKSGISKEETQHWREKLIGKRLLDERGRDGVLADLKRWQVEARKKLGRAEATGSESEVAQAQAVLEELLERERAAPYEPPELDVYESEMPDWWGIMDTLPDDTQKDRIQVQLDWSGMKPYGSRIITLIYRG